MNVHPQLVRTVQLLEDLRRERRDVTLTLEFGLKGLESCVVDRVTSAQIQEIRRRARKIVDSGEAQKVILT